MSTETYLNHPTFGLLFRVCLVEEKRELFSTLYAQRLFFVASNDSDGIEFEPINRTEAKVLVETAYECCVGLAYLRSTISFR